MHRQPARAVGMQAGPMMVRLAAAHQVHEQMRPPSDRRAARRRAARSGSASAWPADAVPGCGRAPPAGCAASGSARRRSRGPAIGSSLPSASTKPACTRALSVSAAIAGGPSAARRIAGSRMRVRRDDLARGQEVVAHETFDAVLPAVARVAHARADHRLQVEGQPFLGAAGDVVQMEPHGPQELPGAAAMLRLGLRSARRRHRRARPWSACRRRSARSSTASAGRAVRRGLP